MKIIAECSLCRQSYEIAIPFSYKLRLFFHLIKEPITIDFECDMCGKLNVYRFLDKLEFEKDKIIKQY